MKRTLMVGVAAGALLAGVSFASAQGTMERQQPGASSGGASTEQPKGGNAQQQQKGRSGAEMKADQPGGKASAQSQDKQDNMKGTTGQAPQGQRAQDAQKQGDQKAGDQKAGDQKAQGAQKTDQKPDAQKSGASAQGDSKASASGGKVSLNTEQKTKIRETVLKSGPRVSKTNINFSISVGTVVPRTVTLAPLPAVLVEVNPAWRSYQYFIVDEEIVIVEPGTMKIITIINV